MYTGRVVISTSWDTDYNYGADADGNRGCVQRFIDYGCVQLVLSKGDDDLAIAEITDSYVI